MDSWQWLGVLVAAAPFIAAPLMVRSAPEPDGPDSALRVAATVAAIAALGCVWMLGVVLIYGWEPGQ